MLLDVTSIIGLGGQTFTQMLECRLCGGSEAGEARKVLLTLLADIAGNRAALQVLESELVKFSDSSCKNKHLESTLCGF